MLALIMLLRGSLFKEFKMSDPRLADIINTGKRIEIEPSDKEILWAGIGLTCAVGFVLCIIGGIIMGVAK